MTSHPPPRVSRKLFAASATLLAALFLGSVVFEVARTPKKPRVLPGVPCLVVTGARTFPVPSSSGITFVTDGDRFAARSRPTFWYVLGRGRQATARRVQFLEHSTPQTSFPVRLPSAVPTTLDIGTWASITPVVFALRQTSSGIVVTGSTVGRGSRVIVRGLAKAALPRHDVRDLAIARAGGTRPDLFVIDRHSPTGVTRLSIYSGESRFRTPIVQGRVIFRGELEPRTWSFDVAGPAHGPANVIFVRRAAGAPTGRPEVHVLSGRSDFEKFDVHDVLSAQLGNMSQAAVGPSPAGPSLYAFRPVGRTAERMSVTPIATPVVDEGC